MKYRDAVRFWPRNTAARRWRRLSNSNPAWNFRWSDYRAHSQRWRVRQH